MEIINIMKKLEKIKLMPTGMSLTGGVILDALIQSLIKDLEEIMNNLFH